MDGSVEEAGRQALALTKEQFPQAVEVVDFADPAAFDRRANDSQSAADILRRSCGIHLSAGAPDPDGAVRAGAALAAGAHPYPGPGEPMGKLLIDPNCPRLKEAFKSAYHFKTLPGAQARYHDIPEKNWASHIMNALEYAIGRLDAGLDEASDRDPLPPLEFPHAVGVCPASRATPADHGDRGWPTRCSGSPVVSGSWSLGCRTTSAELGARSAPASGRRRRPIALPSQIITVRVILVDQKMWGGLRCPVDHPWTVSAWPHQSNRPLISDFWISCAQGGHCRHGRWRIIIRSGRRQIGSIRTTLTPARPTRRVSGCIRGREVSWCR